MKVCLVIDSLGAGGAEKSTQLWAAYLRNTGHTVLIIYFERKKKGVEETMMDYSLHFISSTSWLGRYRKFVNVLKKENPDIIHSALFNSNLLLRLSRIFFKKPSLESLVTTPYLPQRFGDRRISKRKIEVIKWVDKLTARLLSDQFHALTETVRDHYVQHLGIPASKMYVIPRGRERNQWIGHARENLRNQLALNYQAGDCMLVSVGRHEYVKGHITILQALNVLVNERGRVNIKLVLLGREGAETNKLKAYCEENKLKGHVLFAGYRHDVPVFLAAADLFIFLSHYEGLGGALLEAQAAGLPVICSDIPVFHEVTGDRGVRFVQVNDISGLADTLDKLAGDVAWREELAKQSLANFEAHFELSDIFKRMTRLYEQMIV